MVCPPNHGHFFYLFVIEILTPKSWWVMVGEWFGRPWPLINCCLCRSCRGSCASSGASKPAGPLRPWRGAVEAAPGWKFKNLSDSIRFYHWESFHFVVGEYNFHMTPQYVFFFMFFLCFFFLSRLEALKPEMSRRGFPGFFQHWDVGFWL
jgi:hypothetical protein